MTLSSKTIQTLGVLSLTAGALFAGTAANAQQSLSMDECREVMEMNQAFVRRAVRQACGSALAALAANETAVTRGTSAEFNADADVNSGGSGSGGGDTASGGGGGNGTAPLTITASAFRDGRLDPSVCLGMTGGGTQTCSLVLMQTARGARHMLLGDGGVVLNADVDINGRDFIDLTVAANQSGLAVDADLVGHDLVDVGVNGGGSHGGGLNVDADLGGHDLADVSVGSGSDGGLSVGADVGGHSVADVSVGGGSGLSISVGLLN
ncbi:hypothetical protein [Gymnodinialimonas sp. 57CJ19]|uniref:hypothetical protein n=1 Tax=Gymnodinialimonas sp. 57CJ19 TaxID=3138498 RepID=UPI00313434E9